jgi:hypothetical protein
MFSFVCALPSPTSAKGCPFLFGWLTGSTAQSDFSSTCVSRRSVYGLRGPALIVRPRRAGDLPVLVRVVSQRARVLRLRRTEQPLAFNTAAVLPASIGTKSASCSIGFSQINSPAHRSSLPPTETPTSRLETSSSTTSPNPFPEASATTLVHQPRRRDGDQQSATNSWHSSQFAGQFFCYIAHVSLEFRTFRIDPLSALRSP